MRSILFVAVAVGVAVAAVACDPVHLRAPAPLDPPEAEVEEDLSNPAALVSPGCSRRCLGGRQCSEGRCLPQWLPIASPELSRSLPRVGHYAVWTGSEVIVWGGRNPNARGASEPYGDGFRFEPERGEVRLISQRAAPAARFADGAQFAVWTGRQMIVWGGRTDAGEVSSGAAYLPASDRWVTLAWGTSPALSLSPVFTGSQLVLAGARGPDDAWRWDASRASWVRATSINPDAQTPRTGHSAVWTGSELIVWGGSDASGSLLSEAWRFSPSRNRTRAAASAGHALARTRHAAVWAGSEMLVFGGQRADGAAIGALASYIPASDTWVARNTRGAPAARFGHVAVWTGSSLIVWGGVDERSRRFNDGAEYDPWDDQWTALGGPDAPTGTALEGAVGVWTGSELIVVGGSDGGPRLAQLGWRYQP